MPHWGFTLYSGQYQRGKYQMRAIRFALKVWGRQHRRILLSSLVMPFYFMTSLAEQQDPHPQSPHPYQLPRIVQRQDFGLQQLSKSHPNSLLLPQSLPPQLTSLAARYFPSHRLYSVSGNKIQITNENSQYRQIEVDESDDMGWLHYALNFTNPPKTATREMFEKSLQMLQRDQCIVYTFLPEKDKYREWVGPIDQFDKFSANKVKNLNEIQKEFNALKYQSSNNKALYVTIKSEELAKKLNLGYKHVGDYFIIRKSTNLIDNQSNFIYGNLRCHVQKVQPDVNREQTTADFQFKKNFIRSASLPYISEINIDTDYFNFIRNTKRSPTGNLIVIGINDDEKQEFLDKIHKVLFELKKMFKEELDILVTQNKRILTDKLHIEPDDFVTLRLVNLHQRQPEKPIFEDFQVNTTTLPNKHNFFTRYKYVGPFKYSEMVEFIRNPNKQQHYEENNKLKLIKKIMPQELGKANGLILYEKKGCGGCEFLNSVLQQLQTIIKQVSTKGSKVQDYTYLYKITNPQKLKNLKLYRYNILNQNPQFKSPLTTPQLFLFQDGIPKPIDLKQQSFLDPKQLLKKIIDMVSQ